MTILELKSGVLSPFYRTFKWGYGAKRYIEQYPSEGRTMRVSSLGEVAVEPPLEIHTLRNMLLFTGNDLIASLFGHLLGESVFYPGIPLNFPPDQVTLARIDARERIGTPTVPLTGIWAQYFYHWVMEFLIRALIAEKGGHTGAYLIASDAPPFVRESLMLLGIASDRMVPKTREALFFETLVVPEVVLGTTGHGRRSVEDSPAILRALRETLLSAVSKGDGPERVYITRRLSERGRRIVNEEEVSSLLESHGFVPVAMETLSVREQISLMRNARMLAGPHGAGMVHALFMQPGSTIIEIFQPGEERNANRATLTMLGHRRVAVFGKATGERVEDLTDIEVDVAEIEHALRGS